METEEDQIKQDLYKKLLSYPPFYTLQPHVETRNKQLTQWAEIVHSYFKNKRILDCSLSQLNSCPIFQDNSTGVPKKLSKEEIREILQKMEELNTIEWKGEENFSVNLTSPFELADAIYQWAKDKKLIGYTETLKGISQGEQTNKKLKFYELPQEQILRGCQILEETGRADVYEFDGMYSVKFK